MTTDKQQMRLCILVSSMLSFSAVLTSLQVTMNVYLNGVIPFRTDLFYIVYFALIVWTAVHSSLKISMSTLVFTAFVVLSFMVTIIFFPQNIDYVIANAPGISFYENPIFILIFFSLIGFYFARQIYDVSLLGKVYEKFAYFTIAALTVRYILGLTLKGAVPEYMTFSYNLLLPTAFLLLMAMKEGRVSRWLFGIGGSFLILIAGCRGALVSLLAVVSIYQLFFSGSSKRIKFIILITFVVIVAAVFLFDIKALSAVYAFLQSKGINSRTFEMFLKQSFFDDSGRGGIQAQAHEYINLFGHGLWGDRVLLNRYPHNMAIEMMVHYGCIIGTSLFTYVVWKIIAGLRFASEYTAPIFVALLSTGFFRLLFSGSYLEQEPAFFILLGLCMNCTTIKIRRKYTI